MSAETPGKEPMDRLIELATRARAQNGSPKEPDATEQEALGLLAAYFEEASGKTSIWVQMRLTDLDSGRALLAAEPAVQVAAVRLAFTGLQQQDGSLLRQLLAGLHRPLGLGEIDSYFAYVGLRTLLGGLARRQLPYRDEDMVQILTVVSRRGGWEWLPLEACFRSMQRRIAECGLSPEVREALVAVQRAGDKQVTDAATRKALAIVNELLREGEREPVEIEPDDDWGRVARPALAEVPTTERFSWVALLVHAQTATAAKPSAAWQRTARERIAAMGEEAFCARVIAWLDLLQAPPSNEMRRGSGVGMLAGLDQVPRAIPTERNANLLRGIVWHCALVDDEALATAVARAAEACFKKLPEVGARCTKAGNACLWALGAMPGGQGAPHLVRLQGKVKQPSARGRLETTLDQTAERVGVNREALEDQAVPTHGLENGPPRTTVGEYVAEIVVRGPTDVAVEWEGADGARLVEPPAALRKAQPAELKRVDQAATEIRKTLAAQRLRVERLLLSENWWSYGRWRELYLAHPLLQVLARRLIWAFGDAEQPTLGAWLDGQLVDVDERPLDDLADDTPVRLWHPILTPADTVLAWRRWLERHAVTQPFKQAHREIYILTDAERETRDHSNRFAEHILRQHQFRALCLERGWKYGLQGSFDNGENATPTLSLPRWKLTVQFDVEPIEDDDSMTPHGIFRYVTTDAVRFARTTAAANDRQAQQALRREFRRRALEILRGARPGALREIAEESRALLQALPEPIPLPEVPPVVFSEVMRDVDLFVGVCSVGADPTWADQAPEDQAGYWHRFAFGELAASAQTRRAVLERIVPRLAIAPRCTLEDRFLVVRGDLRTYRIHLGSGNIQMEPNNQYLCIVPAKGPSFPGEPGHIYLPFEGDSTMAVILSKAFMLANDTAIKDPSITRQIHAR